MMAGGGGGRGPSSSFISDSAAEHTCQLTRVPGAVGTCVPGPGTAASVPHSGAVGLFPASACLYEPCRPDDPRMWAYVSHPLGSMLRSGLAVSQVTYFSPCGKVRDGAARAWAMAAFTGTLRLRVQPGRRGPGQAVRPEQPLPPESPPLPGMKAALRLLQPLGGWQDPDTGLRVGGARPVCGSRKPAGLWARPVRGWFSSGTTHRP